MKQLLQHLSLVAPLTQRPPAREVAVPFSGSLVYNLTASVTQFSPGASFFLVISHPRMGSLCTQIKYTIEKKSSLTASHILSTRINNSLNYAVMGNPLPVLALAHWPRALLMLLAGPCLVSRTPV